MARVEVEQRGPKPHTHRLPSGEQYSDPANDRECMRNGGHKKGSKVVCEVEDDCEHSFGRVCTMCDRVT